MEHKEDIDKNHNKEDYILKKKYDNDIEPIDWNDM